MILAASLLSTLHLLALGLGLPGVFLRGRALRRLARGEPGAVEAVLAADNAWGVAALLWVGTGLARALGGFEKGAAYYGHSATFWLKMGCLLAILALEVLPMITFIRWRLARARQAPLELSGVPRLARLNAAELALTVAMPFLASAMARGLGFGVGTAG